MMADLPVSAPPRLRALLAHTDDTALEVVHRGPHAIYLVLPGDDGRCVGVVGSGASAVPCAVRLGTVTVRPLVGDRARLQGGVLHVDDVALRVRRVVDVACPRPGRPAEAGDPLRGIEAGVAAELASLDVRPEGLEALLGRGGGLTPLGDDVVCGWLAAHHAAGSPDPRAADLVRAARSRTTTLSAALVECAAHGEVLPEFASWLAAPEADEPARAAALAAVGHSSGAGLLLGARTALLHLSRKAAA